MEISVVIPERTAFTDLPRSENPPRKNASPERPCVELSSGMSRACPESELVGTSTDTDDGSGSIIATAVRRSSSMVGA